ncbi:MAG: SDR family NAD(P)-dependent oxidoreductase, partial [Ruminococcaceae bacterium]|nr:SDR family NAD(P)-dependent oxidoreductase [Oscillospiraceae bacterium]
MKRFEGRTAMVTGAGKNIGRAIAMDFAREGANVIVCDYNRENAEQTARDIEAMGGDAMLLVSDVRDREAIFAGAAAAIERFGKVDILVNNAGGSAGLLG